MSDSISGLWIDVERRTVCLGGYPLPLTDSEFAVVYLIHSSDKSNASVCELTRLFSRSSLSTHVCNINKKSARLSGRELIERHENSYRFCRHLTDN